MIKKITPEHFDILGRPVHIGTKVAVAIHNSLMIGSVIKITSKMIRVMPVRGRGGAGYLVYSNQCVLVEGEDVLAYILKG